jgi:hypothetical protein
MWINIFKNCLIKFACEYWLRFKTWFSAFSQQNQVFDEAASPQPIEKPLNTYKNTPYP